MLKKIIMLNNLQRTCKYFCLNNLLGLLFFHCNSVLEVLLKSVNVWNTKSQA